MAGAGRPVSFGYKLGWFAVRARPPEEVAEALGLQVLRPCGWSEGIEAVYSEDGGELVFITPEVDGWVLAASPWAAGTGEAEGLQQVADVVRRLSSRFGEAQGFATQHVIEYHHWLRATAGHLVRGHAWVGESGERLLDEGEPTQVEAGLWQDTPREEWFPSEEDVLTVAGAWSVNPATLEGRPESSGMGLLARLPAAQGARAPASAVKPARPGFWRRLFS